MKYVIINLSPRKKGTSKMLTNYFHDKIKSDKNSVNTCDLYSNLEKMNIILDKIKASDCIIMIGPCYVCSYPADTTKLLMAMANEEGVLHGQSLYGFTQGGMPYTHTHEHGVKLLECFAQETNVQFKGGFVMGGGATLDGQPLDKIIGGKKMVPAVNKFIDNIKNNKNSGEDLYKEAAMKIPGLVTRMLAIMMNRNLRKDFEKRGIDYEKLRV